MGGSQSIADVDHSRLTPAEASLSKGIFRQLRQPGHEKGCSYESFFKFCEKLHPLLTHFLIEFFFGTKTSIKLITYREFISIYSCFVRGSVKDKAKMMEAFLMELRVETRKSREVTPVAIFNRKFVVMDVNYNMDEHIFKMKQENYLRGLICSYIKQEHTTESEGFSSWRRVKSRFSIGDIDKLTKTLQGDMHVPTSKDDMMKWVRSWRTISMLHHVVYSRFYGLEELQHTKSLYPICVTRHRNNVCLMDMCSILHLNCYLPAKFRHSWKLLFSSAIHGVNFRFLVERTSHEGANIVVIRDRNNFVFGGFASESWQPSSRFYGNYTSFLFRTQPNLQVFEASGKDENYQFMNLKGPRGFGMGKGALDSYGWWIEPERLRGSCAPSCSTFHELPVLAGSQNFEIHSFEIWGVDETPTRHKRKSNIKFHAYAEGKVDDSNIHSAGKALFKRTGMKKYTDGYGVATAEKTWDHHKSEEEGHKEGEPWEESDEYEESDSEAESESDSHHTSHHTSHHSSHHTSHHHSR